MDPIEQVRDEGQRAIDAADVHALEAALVRLADHQRQSSDHKLQTTIHRWRGIAAIFRGDGDTARTEFHRMRDLYTMQNDELGMANSTHDLNILDFREGRYTEVIERCLPLIATLLRLEQHVSAANATDIYASALQQTGQLDEALTQYHKALELYSTAQHDAGIAHAFGNIGTLYGTMGDLPKAMEAGLKALDTFIALHDTYSIARTRTNLGYAYFRMGDLASALEMYVKALEGYMQVHDRESIALAHLNIGT
ncbi:MAG: tetratricopeptide repeat protein, partial [Ignavibacteriae bacterium]